MRVVPVHIPYNPHTKEEHKIQNIIIPDEIFNGLDWKDFNLTDLIDCKIVGVEPIVDGLTEESHTVGICLTVEAPDGMHYAVEVMYEPEVSEIMYSKAEVRWN